MVDNSYYKGFEGEVEVEIYYLDENNKRIGYKLWEGYFENILSGAFSEKHNSGGLLESYVSHGGWYDEVPWRVKDITLAITELKQFRKENLEPELKNMSQRLQEIDIKLVKFFENCQKEKRIVYIEYDN